MGALAALYAVVRSRRPPATTGATLLEIERSGCAAVLEHEGGSICELGDDRVVRAWTRGAPGSVRFSTPLGAVEATSLREVDAGAVEAGMLVRLVVPKDA